MDLHKGLSVEGLLGRTTQWWPLRMQAEWPSPHCSHGCGWLEQPGWRDNIWVLKVKRQHMWRGADALRAFTGARHHADESLGPGSRLGELSIVLKCWVQLFGHRLSTLE